MIKLLVVFSGIMILVAGNGCKMKQDPYSDASDDVKRGIRPFATPQVANLYVHSERLRIDSEPIFNFKEGEAGEYQISGRVLRTEEDKADRDFKVTIDNLSDFPGAQQPVRVEETQSVTDASGQTVQVKIVFYRFSWKPDLIFVADGKQSRSVQMQIKMATTDTDVVMSRGKTVLVTVDNKAQLPKILNIEQNLTTNPIHENEVRDFTVTVQDLDSSDIEGMRPLLVAVPNNPNSSLAHRVYALNTNSNVTNPMQDPDDPTIWKFQMQLDLKDAELTPTRTSMSFDLVPISRFGVLGNRYPLKFTVLTDVSEAVSSYVIPFKITAGKESIVRFSLYEKNGSGRVSGTFDSCEQALPGVTSCECRAQNSYGAQVCEIRWTPDAAITLKTYYVYMRSKVTSPNPEDVDLYKTKYHLIGLTVEAPKP